MIRDVHDPNPPHGILYNADTGERIPLAYRFDDETGDYWHYVPGADGQAQLDPNDQTQVLKANGRCRLKFVPFDENGKAPFAADKPRKIQFREWL